MGIDTPGDGRGPVVVCVHTGRSLGTSVRDDAFIPKNIVGELQVSALEGESINRKDSNKPTKDFYREVGHAVGGCIGVREQVLIGCRNV